LILAAEPKWLAADVAQAAEPKSLLLHAILVPVLVSAVRSVLVRPVAVFSASVVLAAEAKSLLATHVLETTVVELDQAAALKPLAVLLLQFAVLQFSMASRV
jgi:uncharacterized membrane protein YGL010W